VSGFLRLTRNYLDLRTRKLCLLTSLKSHRSCSESVIRTGWVLSKSPSLVLGLVMRPVQNSQGVSWCGSELHTSGKENNVMGMKVLILISHRFSLFQMGCNTHRWQNDWPTRSVTFDSLVSIGESYLQKM